MTETVQLWKANLEAAVCLHCKTFFLSSNPIFKPNQWNVDVQTTDVRVEGLIVQEERSKDSCLWLSFLRPGWLRTFRDKLNHMGKAVGFWILAPPRCERSHRVSFLAKPARGNDWPPSRYSLTRLSRVIERPTSLAQSQQSCTARAQMHD